MFPLFLCCNSCLRPIVLQFTTGPITLILVTLSLTQIGETIDEPIVLFGFLVGLLVVVFTILGFVAPKFFSFALPKDEENKWMMQNEVGPGVVLQDVDFDSLVGEKTERDMTPTISQDSLE